MSDGKSDDESSGVVSFDDMKSLRDEYEDRSRKLEEQLKTDGRARQELIEDLTVELATAREEGERRANAAEEALAAILSDVARIETELSRIRASVALGAAPRTPGPPPATITAATMPPAAATLPPAAPTKP